MDDMKLLSRSSVRQDRMPSSHGCRISANVKMTLGLVGSSARGPSHGEYFVVEPYVIMFTQSVESGNAVWWLHARQQILGPVVV